MGLRRCSDRAGLSACLPVCLPVCVAVYLLILIVCSAAVMFCFDVKPFGYFFCCCYRPKIALLFTFPTPPPSLHPSSLSSSPSNHLCFYYGRSTVSFIRCFSLHLPPCPPLLSTYARLCRADPRVHARSPRSGGRQDGAKMNAFLIVTHTFFCCNVFICLFSRGCLDSVHYVPLAGA